MRSPEAADSTPRTRRAPIDRIGVTVLNELVESIVSGETSPGDALPPETELSAHFGVSRTVIRESMKRLQEKGMVTVAQGRGTHVNPRTGWNMLDPLVLEAMVRNDRTLGVLDELSAVRAALEALMASEAAERADHTTRERLATVLATMSDSLHDPVAFREADMSFHLVMMELSGNELAENVTRMLFTRAVVSDRFNAVDFNAPDPTPSFETSLEEHTRIAEAVWSGDVEAARSTMSEHILGSWLRRRLPSQPDDQAN